MTNEWQLSCWSAHLIIRSVLFVHPISVIAVLPPTQPPKMNKLIENLCWIFLEHSYSIVFYLRFLKRHSVSLGNEDIYLPHLIMDCIYVRPHWNEDTVAMITMPMSFRFFWWNTMCATPTSNAKKICQKVLEGIITNHRLDFSRLDWKWVHVCYGYQALLT